MIALSLFAETVVVKPAGDRIGREPGCMHLFD